MNRSHLPLTGLTNAESRPHVSTPFLLLLIPLLFLSACGTSTETIVVGGQARTVTDADEEVAEVREPSLPVLKIGESNRIRSLDPLFAGNTATKRAILLSYEGLVRFDHNDNIVPAAADSWEVSRDSLTYTFRIRNGLFFHDDESFAQGRGRRVNSRDIVRVFERMASRDVPPDAADLFMNSIRGFESFYLEQREVFLERDRKINNISGIQVIDDATVSFRLLEPDRDFLKKLASPFAVIYPVEPFRFRDTGLHSHAVGTGPFRFSSTVGDSIFIYLRNETYYGRDSQGRRLPLVSRIELMNVRNDLNLLSHFTRGHLNLILDPGPRIVDRMVNDQNMLRDDYVDKFQLRAYANPDPIILRYNTRNRFGLGRADAASVIRNVGPETIMGDLSHPSLVITWQDDDFSQANIARVFRAFGTDTGNRLLLAYNQGQYPLLLSRNITSAMDGNLRVEMEQRRVFSRDIFLYLDYIPTMIPGQVHDRIHNEILRIERDRYLLIDREVDGIRTNSLGWWIDFRHVHRKGAAREPEAAVLQ